MQANAICRDADAAELPLVKDAATLLPKRADVLITDLIDHRSAYVIFAWSAVCFHAARMGNTANFGVRCSVLGMGLLPALDHAGACLLCNKATIVPSRIQVSSILTPFDLCTAQALFDLEITASVAGRILNIRPMVVLGTCRHMDVCKFHVDSAAQVKALLIEMRITDVCGFDISYLNRYRWHPSQERVDMSRCSWNIICRVLSAEGLNWSVCLSQTDCLAPAQLCVHACAGCRHIHGSPIPLMQPT